MALHPREVVGGGGPIGCMLIQERHVNGGSLSEAHNYFLSKISERTLPTGVKRYDAVNFQDVEMRKDLFHDTLDVTENTQAEAREEEKMSHV